MEELLKIQGLKTYFNTDRGLVKAIDGMDLALHKGEVLGIVGESGCGKSMTALSIMGLVPFPGEIVEGAIYFQGEDLVPFKEKEMRRIRGKDIAMIFQDPLTTLNPVLRVGEQIAESIDLHYGGGQWMNKKAFSVFGPFERRRRKDVAWERAIEMMSKVGIPSPEVRMGEYPHQLSGGMRQRAMIAIALSCNPLLLIADEPTTALDVTIQAQILDLLKEIREDSGASILFISHDLGVICEICHKVAVMYAGSIVELASVLEVLESPLHPYTQGLLSSIPRLGDASYRIQPIPGNAPGIEDRPGGCSFSPRCSYCQPLCREKEPPLEEVEGRQIRCFFLKEIEEKRGRKNGKTPS